MFRLKDWTIEHVRILNEAKNLFQLIEACEKIKIHELEFHPSGVLCIRFSYLIPSSLSREEISLGAHLEALAFELIDFCAECLFNDWCRIEFGGCYYFDQKRKELWEKLWSEVKVISKIMH